MAIQKRKTTRLQIEMLDLLERSGKPLHDYELDGRVAKALLARAWASYGRDGVEITEAGRRVLQADGHARSASHTDGDTTAGAATRRGACDPKFCRTKPPARRS